MSEKDPYTVKFCRDEVCKNTVKHEASDQKFSSPPDEPNQAQRQPNQGLKERLDLVKDGILGEPGKNVEFDEYRICCWKFMPTIGRYVANMLDGKLDPSLAKRWAWDGENNGGGTHSHLLPKLEMGDL
ncbi:hypothetical protein G6011_06020 [Alternaria panax]|uniref:Uncharacterized protein n=1 Tax=Alternaria panax TaxID=48097 RepID=A0AAD4FG12_9PLEO|nr:hypothetical protein G6011_06020 [Alternaria panax]